MIPPRRLRRLLDAHGGFTLDPRSGVHVRRGVSVCLDPSRTLRCDRVAWRDEAIALWLSRQTTELHRSHRYLGGWLDHERDQVWLDVVRVVPRVARPAVTALARRHGQRSLYDLGADRLIFLAAGR